MLAETEITTEVVVKVLQGLGIPGAIALIIAWVFKRTFSSLGAFFSERVWPEVVKCTDAYQARQETVAKSQELLVNQTIEIQTKSAQRLQQLVDNLPHVCLARQAVKTENHQTTKGK